MTETTAVKTPHSESDLKRKARLAILRIGVKKEPFRLCDVSPHAAGVSLDMLRRQAKVLVDEKCLVRKYGGIYVAAVAQHKLEDATPAAPKPRNVPSASQKALVAYLAKPRNSIEVAQKLGLTQDTSLYRLRPLIKAGKVHRRRLGRVHFYATTLSALDKLAEAMKVEETPSRSQWAPRFGRVSSIGTTIMRQKAISLAMNHSIQRTAA